MDSFVRSACIGILGFCCLLSPEKTWASPATAIQPGSTFTLNASPQQQLAQCLEQAKAGNVRSAFDQAKALHSTFGQERLFDVSYINTLLSIVDEVDSPLETKIINEVITLVNVVRKAKKYDGVQDAEAAFHFMKALGRLSNITQNINERVSSKVRLYEGKIAVNLSRNPNYPKNAMEALSIPMFSMAQGFAIRGDSKSMVKALKSAVDNGFGDFEKIKKDEILARVHNAKATEKLVVELESRYQGSVKKWAREVLANFPSGQFYFDLPTIDGRRLRKSDFDGKVLVVDMWATWCPPCRKGIPHYIELQKKYGDKNVAVLGVSMDNPKDPMSSLAAVKKFTKEQGFNYPCVMGDLAFGQQIPGKAILPTTIFLDQSGNVRYIARGYHDLGKIEAITNILSNESQPVRATMPSLSR